MKARIALVSGSTILPYFLIDLAFASSTMNSSVVLLKTRALITCLK
jgi:hypothetical protein